MFNSFKEYDAIVCTKNVTGTQIAFYYPVVNNSMLHNWLFCKRRSLSCKEQEFFSESGTPRMSSTVPQKCGEILYSYEVRILMKFRNILLV